MDSGRLSVDVWLSVNELRGLAGVCFTTKIIFYPQGSDCGDLVCLFRTVENRKMHWFGLQISYEIVADSPGRFCRVIVTDSR